MRKISRFTSVALSLLIVWAPAIAFAQASSNNYRAEEVYFGTGGSVDSSSPNYRTQQSSGSLGGSGSQSDPTSSSNNYDASGGALTPSDPFLEMTVMSVNVDFGTLDPNSYSSGAVQGGACNCSFYVRSYLSSNYVVFTASPPPTSENGDELDAKTTLGVPSNDPTLEEFGINLVDNASPDIGANPTNQPDNSFADGEAATGYDSADNFKYIPGDIIARSQATAGKPAIGLTEYTISYIAKPSSITPAGQYTMNSLLIVTDTF
jgi:hypothetical protein